MKQQNYWMTLTASRHVFFFFFLDATSREYSESENVAHPRPITFIPVDEAAPGSVQMAPWLLVLCSNSNVLFAAHILYETQHCYKDADLEHDLFFFLFHITRFNPSVKPSHSAWILHATALFSYSHNKLKSAMENRNSPAIFSSKLSGRKGALINRIKYPQV